MTTEEILAHPLLLEAVGYTIEQYRGRPDKESDLSALIALSVVLGFRASVAPRNDRNLRDLDERIAMLHQASRPTEPLEAFSSELLAWVMTSDSPIDALLQQTLDTLGDLPMYVRPTMRMTTRIEVRPARAPRMPGKRERADRREIVATFEDRSAKLLTHGMFRHEITF